MSIPRSTLFERVTFYLEHERRKHDKPDNHTVREVNSWTNYELLEHLSQAIEEIRDAD